MTDTIESMKAEIAKLRERFDGYRADAVEHALELQARAKAAEAALARLTQERDEAASDARTLRGYINTYGETPTMTAASRDRWEYHAKTAAAALARLTTPGEGALDMAEKFVDGLDETSELANGIAYLMCEYAAPHIARAERAERRVEKMRLTVQAAREMATACRLVVSSDNASDAEVLRFEKARHQLQQTVAALAADGDAE